MGYRKLSEAEVRALFVTDYSTENWELVRDLALSVYGPEATHVEVVVSSEYNDEGYDDRVTDVIVTNKKGKELHPDLHLPYFAELEDTYTQTEYPITEMGTAKRYDYSNPIVHTYTLNRKRPTKLDSSIVEEYMQEKEYQHKFPINGQTKDYESFSSHYDITSPFKHTFPDLYVLEEDHS